MFTWLNASHTNTNTQIRTPMCSHARHISCRSDSARGDLASRLSRGRGTGPCGEATASGALRKPRAAHTRFHMATQHQEPHLVSVARNLKPVPAFLVPHDGHVREPDLVHWGEISRHPDLHNGARLPLPRCKPRPYGAKLPHDRALERKPPAAITFSFSD